MRSPVALRPRWVTSMAPGPVNRGTQPSTFSAPPPGNSIGRTARVSYAVPPGQELVAPGQAPNPSYVVPTEGTDAQGYLDSAFGAYALRPGASALESTPDKMRLGQFPKRDMMPEPNYAPGYFWTGPRGPGTEKIARHGVEFQDADGIQLKPPAAGQSAPDPRWVARPEPRVTNRLSPHTYTFTRPFNQETERYYNGVHFSMADHRRNYDILGMQPFAYKRNTYRADPVPWDEDRIDMPNPSGRATAGPIVAFDIPPSGSQSWRL
jgi:hypothetical protein